MTEPVLVASSISRRSPVRGADLLRNCSLAVVPGDRTVLVGPSGSGKTLLLRALAGMDPLDGGALYWQCKPVGDDFMPAYRTRVAYVRQRPALFDGTVEDSLRLPFTLAIRQREQFDLARALDFLKLIDRPESFLEKDLRDLSGGEMQMVALLRVLQLDPMLLLLDEPTAALDTASTQAIERVVLHWVNRPGAQRSFIWVTHDPAQAIRVGNNFLTMRNGQVSSQEVGHESRVS